MAYCLAYATARVRTPRPTHGRHAAGTTFPEGFAGHAN